MGYNRTEQQLYDAEIMLERRIRHYTTRLGTGYWEGSGLRAEREQLRLNLEQVRYLLNDPSESDQRKLREWEVYRRTQ